MKCDTVRDARAEKLTSTCYSVDHPSVPRSNKAVRMELRRTAWEIYALPGERTRLSLEIEIPAAAAVGVPAFVVKYCQRSLLQDSVNALLEANARLRLPPHMSFIGWRRDRRATRAARAAAAAAMAHDGSAWPPLLFAALLVATSIALLQGVLFALPYAAAGRLTASAGLRVARRRGSPVVVTAGFGEPGVVDADDAANRAGLPACSDAPGLPGKS